MSFKNIWKNKVNGVDDVLAEDINLIAQEIISIREAVEDDSEDLNTHRTSKILDHPDGSVTTEKIADGAISSEKLGIDVKELLEEHSEHLSDIQSDIDNIAIVPTAQGEVSISIHDSSEAPFKNIRIFGKTYQDDIPNWEWDAPFTTPYSEFDVTLTGDWYHPEQILSINAPISMGGVQVPQYGGEIYETPSEENGYYYVDELGYRWNYKDSENRKWTCNEINFARGAYVQRIAYTQVNITELSTIQGYPVGIMYTSDIRKIRGLGGALCERAAYVNMYDVLYGEPLTPNTFCEESAKFTFVGEADDTLETLQEKYNGAELMYVLDEPIETPLSDVEITAYKALHAYKPNTNIAVSTFGLELSVDYLADTKSYIDNKIKSEVAELKALILEV